MISIVLINGFLDRCVSAIFEFSGNEFELGENKIEREREPIIFSYDRGPLNSVIILRKLHNISERYYFGTRNHFEVEDGEGRGGGAIGSGAIFFVCRAFSKCPAHQKKSQSS